MVTKMNNTEADLNVFDAGTSQQSMSGQSNGEPSLPTFDPSSMYYDMTGDKILLIFNHFIFKKTRYFNGTPTTRNGTHLDVKALKDTFNKLGFKILTYTDLNHDDIITIIKGIAFQDHSRTSCLVVVILTHGDRDGKVYAADRPYPLKDITSIIQSGNCGLVNKPKLFFVQACRGPKIDDGRTVQIDGGLQTLLLPSHVDFLITQSSVDDHVSWRDKNGSWMIQELCEVIRNHGESMDLLHMITLTNKNVAYKRASNVPIDTTQHNKKQTMETRFTLTKLLKF